MKRVYPRVLEIILLLLTSNTQMVAQFQHHNWFFGDSPVGIRFDTATHTPALVQTQAHPYGIEGSATVSDPNTGELLFYTDGERIYNSQHNLITDGLGAHPSSGQAAVVSAVPCECNKYYIFSNSAFNANGVADPGIIKTTIIDMKNGSVPAATKAILLLDSVAEGNMIIPKTGTDEYWLVGRKHTGTQYYVFEISCKGISGPVWYDFITEGMSGNDYTYNIKYSPASQKIAVACQSGVVYTLDFNATSGTLSNYRQIQLGGNFTYDVEWSPDGTKLYYARYLPPEIHQYDFTTQITTNIHSGGTRGGGLKLGPDGSIYYIPEVFGSFISRIKDPNASGLACNFQNNVLNMGVPIRSYKLPYTFGLPSLFLQLENDSSTICEGQQLQIGVSGGSNHRWTPSTGLSCTDCSNPIASPLTSTHYRVSVSDEVGCQVDTVLFVRVSVPPEINPPLAKVQRICSDAREPLKLGQGLVAAGDHTYSWSPKTGLAQSSTPNPELFPGIFSPGDYNYVLRVSNSDGCSSWDSTLVRILESPAVQASQIITPSCHYSSDGSIAVKVSRGQAPFRYQWANGSSGQSLANISSGTYTLTLTDSSGCKVTETFVVMSPEPLDLKILMKEDASCHQANGSLVVQASGGTGDLSYLWSTNPPFGGIGMDQLAPGDYEVTVRDVKGCWDSLLVTIGDVTAQTARFEAFPHADGPLCLSQAEISFKNRSEKASAYLWDFGDGDTTSLVSPSHKFDSPGTYLVILTAFPPAGDCLSRDTMEFVIEGEGALFVPDAFTPNGDGINDQFMLIGHNPLELECNIFDRWGKKLFTIPDLNTSWDGKGPDGNKQPEGVYTYVLNARLSNCLIREKAGTITLIR